VIAKMFGKNTPKKQFLKTKIRSNACFFVASSHPDPFWVISFNAICFIKFI